MGHEKGISKRQFHITKFPATKIQKTWNDVMLVTNMKALEK